MARRSSPQPPAEVELTAAQMRSAISRFQRRIGDLEAFDPQAVPTRSDPSIAALEASIDEALSETFGHGAHAYRRYSPAAELDTAGINMNGTSHHEVVEGLVHGKDRAMVLLKQAIRSFEEKLGDQEQSALPTTKVDGSDFEVSLDVFVVHGHDIVAKNEVARDPPARPAEQFCIR
jgi:hypothetical protein